MIKIYEEPYVTKFCKNKRETDKSKGWFTTAIDALGCKKCLDFGGYENDKHGNYVLCGGLKND